MAYEYFSCKNHFKRQKYAPPKASNIEYFWTLSHHDEGFHVLLCYPYTNVKKMVRQKNVWIRHYSGTDWEGGSNIFLKGGGGGEQTLRTIIAGFGFRQVLIYQDKFRFIKYKENSLSPKKIMTRTSYGNGNVNFNWLLMHLKKEPFIRALKIRKTPRQNL